LVKKEGREESEKIDIEGVLFFRLHKDHTGDTYYIMSQDETMNKTMPDGAEEIERYFKMQVAKFKDV
jgi:hypothetical protein